MHEVTTEKLHVVKQNRDQLLAHIGEGVDMDKVADVYDKLIKLLQSGFVQATGG